MAAPSRCLTNDPQNLHSARPLVSPPEQHRENAGMERKKREKRGKEKCINSAQPRTHIRPTFVSSEAAEKASGTPRAIARKLQEKKRQIDTHLHTYSYRHTESESERERERVREREN